MTDKLVHATVNWRRAATGWDVDALHQYMFFELCSKKIEAEKFDNYCVPLANLSFHPFAVQFCILVSRLLKWLNLLLCTAGVAAHVRCVWLCPCV